MADNLTTILCRCHEIWEPQLPGNLFIYIHIYKPFYIYRVSHELRSLLRESVPYVKIYRYNPKHLYPKLNGYGDNGKRSLKLWQLLHTYWLPNSYWNRQEYVVSVMLISVLNIKVACEWHKAIKLKYKNIRTRVIVIFRVRSTIHHTGMPNADVTWLAWLTWLTAHLAYYITTKIQGLISRHKRCTICHMIDYIIIIYKCGPCPVFYEL